ncbi:MULTISPECIES: hypothetical protein [unclassified Streptomyces]|nr:hypothetical protein OG518_08625 [Streptomyces sp. NBC_01397]
MFIVAGAHAGHRHRLRATQVLLVVVLLGLAVALFRMAGALNRKADAARREVLGE